MTSFFVNKLSGPRRQRFPGCRFDFSITVFDPDMNHKLSHKKDNFYVILVSKNKSLKKWYSMQKKNIFSKNTQNIDFPTKISYFEGN